MNNMQAYKNWELFDSLPDGYSFAKGIGSPLHGYAFASNGIPLRGGKMALVRVRQPNTEQQTAVRKPAQPDSKSP